MLNFETCQALHACPLCQSTQALLVARRCRNGEQLNTVVCAGCGLGRRDPMPTDDELFAYYSQNYRVEIGKGHKPTKRRLWRIGACALGRVHDQIAHGVCGRTLDFGCGASEMVYLQAQAGLESRGFDPDSSHIAWAQSTLGANVEHQSYRGVPVEPGSMDLVTLYHVLEHIPDPADALRRCHQWLRPGGQLIVEVPNLLSLEQAPGNQFIKVHLYYFHLQALVELALRCGFQCTSGAVYNRDENIRCYFTKVAELASGPESGSGIESGPVAWGENAVAHATAVLAAHTRTAHYLTSAPYRRMWVKLARNVAEALHTAGKDELAILNAHAVKLRP